MVLKKANSRLYALRLLKKAGLLPADIVQIYVSFMRSRIEYESPVWSSLTKSLSYPALAYEEALETLKLQPLSLPREAACRKFVESFRLDASPVNPLTKIMEISPRIREHMIMTCGMIILIKLYYIFT